MVSRSLEFKLLGGFPGEAVTPEVAVGGGLLVDGVLQLKIFDNLARAEVEVLLNNLQKLLLALRRRSVAERESQEITNANRLREKRQVGWKSCEQPGN